MKAVTPELVRRMNASYRRTAVLEVLADGVARGSSWSDLGSSSSDVGPALLGLLSDDLIRPVSWDRAPGARRRVRTYTISERGAALMRLWNGAWFRDPRP